MKACDLDFLLFYDFPHILSQSNVALGLFFFPYCVYQALWFTQTRTDVWLFIAGSHSLSTLNAGFELGCINIMLFLFFVVIKDGIYV